MLNDYSMSISTVMVFTKGECVVAVQPLIMSLQLSQFLDELLQAFGGIGKA